MTSLDHRTIVIAGGGVGAIEAALGLRELASERVEVTLLAPAPALVIAPERVAEVAGGPPASRYDLAAIASDLGVALMADSLASVEPADHRLRIRGGATLSYDALLLALGARPGPVLPGALSFAGPRDEAKLRSALELIREVATPSIAFVATSGVGWTLPLYELALLVAARFDADGLPRDIVIVTPEPQPLAIFGQTASREVAHRLASSGIRTRLGTIAESVEDGRVWLAAGGSLPADLAIALPEPLGPTVPGLPADQHGFVPVDRHGRVAGVPDVWAVGDMTARPIKQGGLAAQQANVAAQSIAAWAGAAVDPQPYEPVLRGMLLTGDAPRFLRRSATSTVPSTSSDRPLWSPASKLVGPRLGP